jgi:hypothetical protein
MFKQLMSRTVRQAAIVAGAVAVLGAGTAFASGARPIINGVPGGSVPNASTNANSDFVPGGAMPIINGGTGTSTTCGTTNPGKPKGEDKGKKKGEDKDCAATTKDAPEQPDTDTETESPETGD